MQYSYSQFKELHTKLEDNYYVRPLQVNTFSLMTFNAFISVALQTSFWRATIYLYHPFFYSVTFSLFSDRPSGHSEKKKLHEYRCVCCLLKCDSACNHLQKKWQPRHVPTHIIYQYVSYVTLLEGWVLLAPPKRHWLTQLSSYVAQAKLKFFLDSSLAMSLTVFTRI